MKFLIIVFIAVCLVKLSKGENSCCHIHLNCVTTETYENFQDIYATSAIQRMTKTASTSRPSPTAYTKVFTVIWKKRAGRIATPFTYQVRKTSLSH